MEKMHAQNITISVEVEKIRRDGDIEIFLGTKGVKLVFVSKDYVKARGYDSAEPFFKFCENLCQEGVTIVVPWGEKGAYARGPNGEIAFSKAETVNEVKETLGAGDTFNGAFLHAHVSGKPLKESLDFANMVAGYKIRHQGFACVSKLCKLSFTEVRRSMQPPVKRQRVRSPSPPHEEYTLAEDVFSIPDMND
eukprot:UN03793